jgi:hypothetical protein
MKIQPIRKYIWTNHALKRLKERKIPQSLMSQVLLNPGRTIYKKDGTIELQSRFENKLIAAIVKDNSRGEKIILSCWINPPYPGTTDFKKRERYLAKQKGSIIRKIWLSLLDVMGL